MTTTATLLAPPIATMASTVVTGHEGQRRRTYADLLALWEATPPEPELTPEEIAGPKLPTVNLPGGSFRVIDAAKELGTLLNQTGKFFIFGGAFSFLRRTESGSIDCLEPVKTPSLPSAFEEVAALGVTTLNEDLMEVFLPKTCSEATARLIRESEAFRREISSIRLLSRSPVLVDLDGELHQVCGYDARSQIITDTWTADDVALPEATELLISLLADFRFPTPSDQSRALAAMITPALISGDLLKARAPMDLGEADESQTGKGYRNKITAAMYGHVVTSVTQRKTAVGGFEETFNARLIAGDSFISFDNARGNIDSPAFESFLTEDRYVARAAYSENVVIDPRRLVVMFTSNKADLTIDLANRSSCVRILKQPSDYQFRSFPEGDLLDHVRANKSRYLGAVFAIVKAWHQAGRPTTNEGRHSFGRWARTLDWIVQNIFGCAPLLDGHTETQARMANPALGWLRSVAIRAKKARRLSVALRTHHILDLLEDSDIEIPGFREGADINSDDTRSAVLQAIGRKLTKCFGPSDEITLDNISVVRGEDIDREKGRTVKTYAFKELDSPPIVPPIPPMHPLSDFRIGGSTEVYTEQQVTETVPPIPPNAPNNTLAVSDSTHDTRTHSNAHPMEALGGLGGHRGKPDGIGGTSLPTAPPASAPPACDHDYLDERIGPETVRSICRKCGETHIYGPSQVMEDDTR